VSIIQPRNLGKLEERELSTCRVKLMTVKHSFKLFGIKTLLKVGLFGNGLPITEKFEEKITTDLHHKITQFGN
tara:strand:+ start:292 stop:510 length:219 start_codon:yes stop_codon:yes gene_type:complete